MIDFFKIDQIKLRFQVKSKTSLIRLQNRLQMIDLINDQIVVFIDDILQEDSRFIFYVLKLTIEILIFSTAFDLVRKNKSKMTKTKTKVFKKTKRISKIQKSAKLKKNDQSICK